MFEVRTGCRLHFGLLELAKDQELQFGGLGLMLEQPGWRLRFSLPQEPQVFNEQLEDEVQVRIQHVLRRLGNTGNTGFRVDPSQRLALHTGLGAGTQLACGVAVGQLLFDQCVASRLSTEQISSGEFFSGKLPFSERDSHWAGIRSALTPLGLSELAKLSGRGLRSAIGLYGFLHGGLILDRGYNHTAEASKADGSKADGSKAEGSEAAGRPIAASMVHWPEEWRVVLIVPSAMTVVSGEQEAKMLHEIGLKPNLHREEMYSLATTALDIVRTATNFEAAMQVIEAYMLLAAKLFAAQQGGSYNGPHVTAAVQSAKRVGLRGVGQSSWGPTVFGFASDEAGAVRMVEELGHQSRDQTISICRPARGGAQWRMVSDVPAFRN